MFVVYVGLRHCVFVKPHMCIIQPAPQVHAHKCAWLSAPSTGSILVHSVDQMSETLCVCARAALHRQLHRIIQPARHDVTRARARTHIGRVVGAMACLVRRLPPVTPCPDHICSRRVCLDGSVERMLPRCTHTLSFYESAVAQTCLFPRQTCNDGFRHHRL